MCGAVAIYTCMYLCTIYYYTYHAIRRYISVADCWNVGAMFPPSILKIDVSTFEDRGSMCRPSKVDDRCVDLRRSMVVVSPFEDR